MDITEGEKLSELPPLTKFEFHDLASGDLAAAVGSDLATLQGLGEALQDLVGDPGRDVRERPFSPLALLAIGEQVARLAKQTMEKCHAAEEWLRERGLVEFLKGESVPKPASRPRRPGATGSAAA